MSDPRLGVFQGPSAIRDFLDPDQHSFVPLVELPGHLNPFRESGVRILAKTMYLLPLLNIKSLPALNMLMHVRVRYSRCGLEDRLSV